MIKYHVNTTRKEIPTHVHQNIGPFGNAANKMKLHLNRTCFHAGLKSLTGMSSFHPLCERTLRLLVFPSVKNSSLFLSLVSFFLSEIKFLCLCIRYLVSFGKSCAGHGKLQQGHGKGSKFFFKMAS